jgi:hypothetical protein
VRCVSDSRASIRQCTTIWRAAEGPNAELSPKGEVAYGIGVTTRRNQVPDETDILKQWQSKLAVVCIDEYLRAGVHVNYLGPLCWCQCTGVRAGEKALGQNVLTDELQLWSPILRTLSS